MMSTGPVSADDLPPATPGAWWRPEFPIEPIPERGFGGTPIAVKGWIREAA